MAHRTRSRTRSGWYGCFQSAPDPAVTCSRTTAKIQRLHPSLAERFGLTARPPARGSNKAGFGQAIKMLPGELDVGPQEVVLGQTEPADRRLRFYTTVGSVPVVLVQPDRQ